MMKKNIIMAILSVLLGLSMLTGCTTESSTTLSNTKTSKTTSESVFYLMAGKVEASEKVDISSKITAKADEISVGIGSKVNKGDPIIKLDSKELMAQVNQAAAGVSTAEANLAKSRSLARPEQVLQAEAACNSANAHYENVKTTYQRNLILFDEGAISKAQLEELETTLAEAESSYKSAKAALDILNKGETQETINVAQSQVKQAQSSLDLTKTQLQNAVINAPISGVITAKNISTGELAAAGSTLFTIVNSDAMMINAYIPVSLINKIKVGQEIVIKVLEIPDKEFIGEINAIDSDIDSKSKNILVKVNFKNQDSQLRSGMFAEVGIRN